jgi:hypothetical protein
MMMRFIRQGLSALALLGVLALSSVPALADPPQGRGNGDERGRRQDRFDRDRDDFFRGDRGRGRSRSKSKFINGRNARDGRFDGRGPRPDRRRGRF